MSGTFFQVRGLDRTDIVRCLYCSIFSSLGGSPANNGDGHNGHNGQRYREDFGVKVLGKVVLLAHSMGDRRLDGSITC
eukprot:7339353-Ditylum_brightwellii.AAC.1